MKILGIGIDIIEIEKVEKLIKNKPRFIDRIFTENEKKYFEQKKFKPQTIAGNFCAKEAISKALGSGVRNFNFKDIEIIRDELGKPIVKTYNNLEVICIEYNVSDIFISISHSDNYATANAMISIKE